MGDWGVGMPAASRLDQFGRVCHEAFGATAYLVGSALKTTDWRDVDVRVILTDDEFASVCWSIWKSLLAGRRAGGGMSEVTLYGDRECSWDDLPTALHEHAEKLGLTRENFETSHVGYVMATRDQAREIVGRHPDVGPAPVLQAPAVVIATPSFFHELLKVWPDAQLDDANDDVRASYELAREHGRPQDAPRSDAA